MTAPPLMESYTFLPLDADGKKCQKDMAANLLHIVDYKHGNKIKHGT